LLRLAQYDAAPASGMPLAFPASPCQTKKSIDFIRDVMDRDWYETKHEPLGIKLVIQWEHY
jgi:hypothetical protein